MKCKRGKCLCVMGANASEMMPRCCATDCRVLVTLYVADVLPKHVCTRLRGYVNMCVYVYVCMCFGLSGPLICGDPREFLANYSTTFACAKRRGTRQLLVLSKRIAAKIWSIAGFLFADEK